MNEIYKYYKNGFTIHFATINTVPGPLLPFFQFHLQYTLLLLIRRATAVKTL